MLSYLFIYFSIGGGGSTSVNGGKRVSPSDRHRASRVDRLTDGSLPAAVDFLLE